MIVECFLDLLCEFAGAESARLTVSAGADGDETVLDVTGRDAGRGRGMTRVGSETAETYLPREFGLMRPFGVLLPEGWGLESPAGDGEWTWKGKIGDLSAELRMGLGAGRTVFLQRRMSAAVRILRLLDGLLPLLLPSPGRLRGSSRGHGEFDPPISGVSKSIGRLREAVARVAQSDVPVLVTGESGTGKELVARNVHSLSRRRAGPLVTVNCMEMPGELLQGELFGAVRGAYTGAQRDRKGLIEAADGGTFFFDEIGELPVFMQASLLRVLQEKEVRRLGDHAIRKVDARFVFATNRDLRDLVERGRFREDLLYRIGSVRLEMPPLRDRVEDIPVLASLFLRDFRERTGAAPAVLSGKALARLCRHAWPGNVRELRNEVERAAAFNPESPVLTGAMISVGSGRCSKGLFEGEEDLNMPLAVAGLERKMIAAALEKSAGNRTRAAKALGITRQGLLKKIKRMGIDPDRFGTASQPISAGPPSG